MDISNTFGTDMRDSVIEVPSMISPFDIQRSYVHLYKEMRRYIWGFDVVAALVDVEVAAYQTCPDLGKLRNAYKLLSNMVREVAREDEDLQKALDEFGDIISESDFTYAKLNQVNEVI